jgi:hypothetical protein
VKRQGRINSYPKKNREPASSASSGNLINKLSSHGDTMTADAVVKRPRMQTGRLEESMDNKDIAQRD